MQTSARAKAKAERERGDFDGGSLSRTVDRWYIAEFPPMIRERLTQVREVIRAGAPDAVETISYAMPTFDLHGHLVHFAAFKSHIGLYPTPTGIERFEEELAPYKGGKGSLSSPSMSRFRWTSSAASSSSGCSRTRPRTRKDGLAASRPHARPANRPPRPWRVPAPAWGQDLVVPVLEELSARVRPSLTRAGDVRALR